MVLDHARAGTRRHDDIVERLEGIDDLPRDVGGMRIGAGVPGGLSATGLHRGHFDRAARVFQQFDRSEAHLRTHEIDEAGDEQADARCS